MSANIVAFVNGWRLALLTIAVLPILALCGGLVAWILTNTNSKVSVAYQEAGSIAEQVILVNVLRSKDNRN